MLLGVVSDTHGHLAKTQAAVRMLESCGVEQIIHCGDIGSLIVLELFKPWKTHYVLGNVDDELQAYREAIERASLTWYGRFGQLELCGRRIAFLHGDDSARLQDTIKSEQFDLVCHGHTHVAKLHRDGQTLVLNPGALYRAPSHTIALVALPSLEIHHIPV